jgi:hypothetical protein
MFVISVLMQQHPLFAGDCGLWIAFAATDSDSLWPEKFPHSSKSDAADNGILVIILLLTWGYFTGVQ